MPTFYKVENYLGNMCCFGIQHDDPTKGLFMPVSEKDNAGGEKFPTEEEQKSSDGKKSEEGGDSSKEEDGADDKSGDDEDKDKGKDNQADKGEDDDAEPTVRKSAKDFIIDRKNKQIQKQKEKKSVADESADDDSADGNDDEETLTAAGQKAVAKAIEEGNRPIIKAMRSQADEQELQDTFTKFPNLKPLEKTIRKYMEHPAYKDVAIDIIALGLAAKRGNLADTASDKKKADDEAAAAKSGGHSRRPKDNGSNGKIPDVSKMSDKELDDLVFKVKTGTMES